MICQNLVECRPSGTLFGDLKAGSRTVAAGAKMQGEVESGWKGARPAPPDERDPAVTARPGRDPAGR